MFIFEGPVYQSLSPYDGEEDIISSSAVYFELRGESGINISTLNVNFGVVSVILGGIFQSGFSGTLFPNHLGYDVYIKPSALFSLGSTVEVISSCEDLNSKFSQKSWSFKIVNGDIIAPVVMSVPSAGLYDSSQVVTLISSEPATIHYTIDGSMPTSSSPIYTSPLTISSNTVLKFFGVDGDLNSGNVSVQIYQINSVAPDTSILSTSIVPSPGQYDNLQFISLTSSKPATIYYQINGSSVLTKENGKKHASPVENIPLLNSTSPQNNVPALIRVDFFSVDHYGNEEPVQTKYFTIGVLENNKAPTNVMVNHPYIRNTYDVSWDDMWPLYNDVIGYNVWRSTNSLGKYERVNRDLIETTFYRDNIVDTLIVDEDVSSKFDVSVPVNINASFEGNIVNTSLWQVFDPDRLFYQNDAMIIEDVWGGKETTVESKFRLVNDFDLNIHFQMITWPVTDPIYSSEVSLILSHTDSTYLKCSRIRSSATDTYSISMFVNSSEVSSSQILTADLDVKIRAVRVGADVSFLFFDGMSWVLLGSFVSFSEDDLKLKFNVRASDKPIRVDWKSLQLTSGIAMNSQLRDPDGEYRFCVNKRPITSRVNPGQKSTSLADVEVKVDGKRAYVKAIDPVEGIVTLETERVYDYVREMWFNPPKPGPGSIVTATYKYTSHNVNRGAVYTSYYYKVTAILADGSETALNFCEPATFHSGKIDYMYQEAMRRNSWLLDQAGERVMLFVKKTVGDKARSYEKNERTHAQPHMTDTQSWGTQFLGGYEGPYEIRIAPLQTENKINMTDRGLKVESSQETWTSMTPVITQRDFILRRNGSIWAVGPVSTPEIRGIPVQQHFSIGHIDRTDIRYKFVESSNLFNYQNYIGLRPPREHHTEDLGIVNGEIVEKDKFRTNKGPGFTDPKGRSLTFENQLF